MELMSDSYTRREFSAMIDVALGGRAAEEMIYGHDDVTSGCSSDLQRATDVATRMIRSYGFSDKVGLVAHGDDESVYLSGKKKDEIEGEIRRYAPLPLTWISLISQIRRRRSSPR
jgi:ATP-dependent metalloprotease